MNRRWLVLALFLAIFGIARADDLDALKVGVQLDGRIVVPTNQILRPAGQQVTFPGRPVDLALTDDGKTLVVKNLHDLVFIDVATARITQTLELYPKESPEPVLEVKEFVTHPIGPSGKPGRPYRAGFSV